MLTPELARPAPRERLLLTECAITVQLAPSSARVLVPTVLVMVGGPWTTTVTRNLALARARKEIWVTNVRNAVTVFTVTDQDRV